MYDAQEKARRPSFFAFCVSFVSLVSFLLYRRFVACTNARTVTQGRSLARFLLYRNRKCSYPPYSSNASSSSSSGNWFASRRSLRAASASTRFPYLAESLALSDRRICDQNKRDPKR